MSEQPCLLCDSPGEKLPNLGDYIKFNCPICGTYQFSGTAQQVFSNSPDKDKKEIKFKLAHHLSNLPAWNDSQENNNRHINEYNLDEIIAQDLPKSEEQFDHLITAIYKNQNDLTELPFVFRLGAQDSQSACITSWFPKEDDRTRPYQIKSGSLDFMGWQNIAKALVSENYLVLGPISNLYRTCSRTLEGFQYYEKLKKGEGLKQIFVALQFSPRKKQRKNDKEGNIKHQQPYYGFNQYLENSLKEALKNKGYNAIVQVERNHSSQTIVTAMQNQIRESKAMIAEVSYENPNVYWEAGFAFALDLPVVYLITKEVEHKPLPFDIRPYPYIVWNDETKYPTPDKLVADILKLIDTPTTSR